MKMPGKDAIDKEIEAIRKLPPKERLSKLRELEEKKKRLEQEAKRIKEESMQELKLDEMLQEIETPRPKDIDQAPGPGRHSVDFELEVSEEELLAARKGGPDYAKNIADISGPSLPSDNHEMYTRGNQQEVVEAVSEAEAGAAYQAAAHGKSAADSKHYQTSSQDVSDGLLASARLEKTMRRDL